MKDFIRLWDYSFEEINDLLELAAELKQKQKAGLSHQYLQGKSLAMIFEKSSTRTRVSFEVGMAQLGGHPLFLSSSELQLGRGETISDTANVLSRYVDGIMIRTFAHDRVVELANHATVPVINGLTDEHHPCQVMADLLTIKEQKGQLQGLKLCYIGDGNNMANSLLEGTVKMGIDIAVATPAGFESNSKVVANVKQLATKQNTNVMITTDPIEAIADADIVYTDVWTSMGQEQEQELRFEKFKAYEVNNRLCAHAKSDFIMLHCLPAHRGEEVSAEILDGPNSVIFDQAENRLHVQKAILAKLMTGTAT